MKAKDSIFSGLFLWQQNRKVSHTNNKYLSRGLEATLHCEISALIISLFIVAGLYMKETLGLKVNYYKDKRLSHNQRFNHKVRY